MNWKLFIGATAPVIAILIYLYYKDKHEKEPLSVLGISFLLGCLSVIFVVIATLLWWDQFPLHILEGNELIYMAIQAFIVVALTEEAGKFLALRYYAFRNKNFNEPFDGIIYAVYISMGFAFVENILYVSQGGMSVAILRTFTAVPAHAMFAVMMGYYAGLAKFAASDSERNRLLARGLFTAIMFHGAYDYFIFIESYPGLAILTLFTLVIGTKQAHKLMNHSSDLSPFKNSWDDPS